jgi:hypothetical protein
MMTEKTVIIIDDGKDGHHHQLPWVLLTVLDWN